MGIAFDVLWQYGINSTGCELFSKSSQAIVETGFAAAASSTKPFGKSDDRHAFLISAIRWHSHKETGLLSSVDRPIGGTLAAHLRATMLGTNGEHIVFSHGFGTDQAAWSQIAPPLSAGARCVLFDLPGASPLLPASFDERRYRSIAGYADDLLNLLDELEISRCTYVGHSVSGMVGVLAAIEAPERFSKLVLLNASPRYIKLPRLCGRLRNRRD